MRPGVPAPVAICIGFVLATVGIAGADDQPRRQVALIDLSEDPAVTRLSAQIYAALNVSEVLRVPDQRSYDQYLTGPLLDEDGPHVAAAKARRADAETALFTNYNAKAALAAAAAGEQELEVVVPTADTTALYAALSLVHGLAQLDQRDPAGAARSFALTHRLDPTAQLDPARYSPDITDAFARAIAVAPATVPLAIQGTGHAWIDGRERGDAPGTFDVERGDHLVVLAGPDRVTAGAAVRVVGAPGKPDALAIADTPASPELQVQRARLALSRAQAAGDDAARAGAMRELAALLGVGDAVMISKRPDGKLQWETWRDRAPGFSAPRLYAHQKPEELLEGLAPPRPPKPAEEPPKPPAVVVRTVPVAVEQAWYERRWVQATAATGLAAAIIGAILWARRDENVAIDHNVQGM